MSKNPPKVEINANRMRLTKVAGGDYDDRQQRVQLEVIARNLDFNKAAEGLTLRYWVLAESLLDKRRLLVIDSGELPVSLTKTPEGREIRHKGELVTLAWDDTGVIFGQRYKGFILVLTNAQDEVAVVKANQPSWQKNYEGALALRKGSWCDMDLKPAEAPRR